MVKRRRSIRTKLITASSELRKGFAVPAKARILSALRGRSKSFIMSCFWFLFVKATKTDKIKVLMKIDGRKSIKRRKTRRKSKTRRKTRRRSKTRKRRKTRRKSSKRRSAKQRANDKRLGKRAKARARKRRR